MVEWAFPLSSPFDKAYEIHGEEMEYSEGRRGRKRVGKEERKRGGRKEGARKAGGRAGGKKKGRN